ncbi:hypothetical protein MMC31_005685 [Peltigera leucophlebia]|nr:hypothetical protein [Peltigera leucophlebia]
MPSLGSLPYEMLAQIMGHITRPTDLKSACLSCKTLSVIATPVLYRDLAIPNDLDDKRKMWKTVEALINSPGIAHVRKLYIGDCSVRTTEVINKLLASLRNDSLRHFSFSKFHKNKFPTESQSEYIWLHQKKLCNLHAGKFSRAVVDLIKRFPDQRGGFLRSVTELGYCLSRKDGNADSPCWPMEYIDPLRLQKLDLHLVWNGDGPTVGSALSFRPLPSLTHLSINEAIFKDNDLNLTSFSHLTHLALINCHSTPFGLFIPDGTALKSLELSCSIHPTRYISDNGQWCEQLTPADFANMLNCFRGLESVAIDMCTGVSSKSRIDLANALRRHKATLSTLIFKHGPSPESSPLTKSSYIHLLNAIKTCKELTQLSLEIAHEIVTERVQNLVESLPGLITFSTSMPDKSEVESAVRTLLTQAPASSKLSLVCFRSEWWIDWRGSGCTSRSFIKQGVQGSVTEIDSKLAKYLVCKSDIIEKGMGDGPAPEGYVHGPRPMGD